MSFFYEGSEYQAELGSMVTDSDPRVLQDWLVERLSGTQALVLVGDARSRTFPHIPALVRTVRQLGWPIVSGILEPPGCQSGVVTAPVYGDVVDAVEGPFVPMQKTFDGQWLEDFDPALFKAAVAAYEQSRLVRIQEDKLYRWLAGLLGAMEEESPIDRIVYGRSAPDL
jgi:hypothetical protein